MGSNSSKTNNETSVLSLKHDFDPASSSDPRSPTPEIIRTPLQTKSGSKHNITKNVDLRKTFESGNNEEKLIHNNPILSAVIKNHLQSYDPRSPTQDFDRTPIIITKKIDVTDNNKSTQLLNENSCESPCLQNDIYDTCVEAQELSPDLIVAKNLCKDFFDISLNDTIEGADEPLGSSTTSNEAIQSDLSNHKDHTKPIKLLETNFDYVKLDKETLKDSEEAIQTTEFDTPDIDINNIPLLKILNDDPRSPSVGIERTPIIIAKFDDNVEEMSDDTLLKVLQNTNAALLENVTKIQDKNQEGILIYEDESNGIDNTPKKSKSINNGSRTPLSCMKNKTDVEHVRSKSVNTVYDSKSQTTLQSKIPKRVSQIPRLKSLVQPKLAGTRSSLSLKNISDTQGITRDCENTPPHSHRDRWDKDNSIVL